LQQLERTYALPAMFADPPEHTRLRGLLSRAFTLRVVESLIPRITLLTNQLLDRVAGKEPFDVIGSIAYALPIATISHLLGMPSENHEQIHELSEAHAMALSAGAVNDKNREVVERADRLRREWAEYFRKLAEERRTNPGENDLITELVRTHDSTDKLTEYELLATIIGLLFAGHTTTADAIGNAVLALLTHRDQWELLVREPSHLESAVEETLRWDPPVQVFLRNALEDTEVAGVKIPKGTTVLAMSGAANRDPEQFPDPERFDITRTPNRHIAFGSGIHFCLGTTLARVQIRTVLGALRERFPNLTLRSERPAFRMSMAFRGVTRLEVAAR
jgi:cytochrome P450